MTDQCPRLFVAVSTNRDINVLLVLATLASPLCVSLALHNGNDCVTGVKPVSGHRLAGLLPPTKTVSDQ